MPDSKIYTTQGKKKILVLMLRMNVRVYNLPVVFISILYAKDKFYVVNRFGHIMSIISCRNITKDEEILVSYNYELLGAPQWYKDLWQSHKRYF